MGDNNNNNNEEVSRRVNRGRQRVEIVRMENESILQVTFSKRRIGLFKKACELCTLCATEMALIVLSPGNKVFSFGNPSVDSILSRNAGERGPVPAGPERLVEAYMAEVVRDMNEQLARVMDDKEAERMRGEEIGRLRREAIDGGGEWWQGPIDRISSQNGIMRFERAPMQLNTVIFVQIDCIVMHTTLAANAASFNLNTPPLLNNSTTNNLNVVAGIARAPPLSLPPFINHDNNNNSHIGFGNNGANEFH